MRCYFLAAYGIMLSRAVNQPQITQRLQPIIQFQIRSASVYVMQLRTWVLADHLLFDIPLIEWLQSREFRPRVFPRITTLPNDMTANKMTNFSIAQLVRLYDQFGLETYVNLTNDTEIRVPTRHVRNGRDLCYCFDPEELFLFTLTKVATGMTNEKIALSRWSYGYRWMIFYLDNWYKDIIGHQGLLRFLPDFPRFRDAIERYCQKDRWYYDHQGNATFVPGIEELPYNVAGWIDDSIDPCRVPFSGPDGDYEGAPRRVQYIDAQESIFSGWKKIHGIKGESVYLPNGISTWYAARSCRENRGT